MNTFQRMDEIIKRLFPSDAEFERAISVKGKTVDKWRRGENHSYRKRISHIARALNTTSAYLLCETDDPAQPQKESPAQEGEVDEGFDMLKGLYLSFDNERRKALLRQANLLDLERKQ